MSNESRTNATTPPISHLSPNSLQDPSSLTPMEEKEQAKPLTSSSPSPQTTTITDEDAAAWRCMIRCGGYCSAVVAILGLVMLVLAFTVLKVKDPVLTLNTIYLNNLEILLSTPNFPVSINASLLADISIKNPNAASLQFDGSMTRFYYMGETVGVAYAPWTKVSAHQTLRMNVTVDVLEDQMLMLTNATGSAMSYGYVNLTSYTDLHGEVSVIGIFKKNMNVIMNCSMSLDVPLSPQQVKNKVCQAYVE